MNNPFNEVDNPRDENDDSAYGPLPIISCLVTTTLILLLAGITLWVITHN